MVEITFVKAVSAAHQPRSLAAPNLDVIEIGLELTLVNSRTHICGLIQSIPDPQLARAFDKAIHKVVINTFFDDDAAGCGAALSSRAERAPQRAFERQLEIGIVEHNHRIFAAEFERAVLKAFRRSRSNCAANGA